MPGAEASPAHRGLVRALMLSVAAAAIPITGTFLFPDSLQDYEALTWLTLLVPAFLWAYERGWRGVATALAFGMASLSTTYAVMELSGGTVPELLLPVVVVYVVISLAIGLFGDRVARANFDDAAQTLALLDTATGLPNRRHAELHLDLEYAAAERGRALAVVLFDIDAFDAYNGRHGREAGDSVLKGLGTLLQQHTRRMDLAARYGPDEFMSVLGGCTEEGALVFAGRLQERLRAAEHTLGLPTVSAGIACYRPELTSPTDLLREAEQALSLAKGEGGDRVRIFGRDLRDLELPDDHAVQRAAAAGEADATALLRAARAEVDSGVSPVGRGRSALVLSGDAEVRKQLTDFLQAERFQVFEAGSFTDGVAHLQNEFDLVFLEVAANAAGLADLVRQVRARSPLTRIIGMPRTVGGTLEANVLDIRVDGHFVPSGDDSALRDRVAELLQERDALKAVRMRQQQLSHEIRARDRESRAALEASEARYQSVVQAVHEVVFATDSQARLTFLNPAWTAITGFTTEESTGRSLFSFIHPADIQSVRSSFDAMCRDRSLYFRHEGRWRTRTGVSRWMELRMQLMYTPAGDFESASGVLTDVTDRRQAEEALRRSEEYFRSLIENAADMMAVLNSDNTVRYASPAVERVLGFTPTALIGTGLLECVHPEDAPDITERLGYITDQPGSEVLTEMRMRHAAGGWRIVEATFRNLLLTPGVDGIVINARDVTDRHIAAEAIRESEATLLRAQKMESIGRLAGGVAHDFNNLLTAIQGHADLLIGDLDSDSAIRSDLMEIRDAAGRATSLTRQLLAFSRRQVMQPRVLDFNAIISGMHKVLGRVIGEHVKLEMELADDVMPVRADPAQIEQVLLNLVVNARDAMPQGGTAVIATSTQHVRAGHRLAGEIATGPYVLLRVVDNGSGMSPAVAANAFEPFFTTKDQGRGTGLGLSTVYGIVKQSGGHAWLTSEPGAGTEVSVLLPAVEAAAEAASRSSTPGVIRQLPEPILNRPNGAAVPSLPAESAPPETAVPATDRVRQTIMLVEDEKAVRDLTLRILERQGYDVIMAGNGREALDVMSAEPRRIDLLLTDVIMPEMNGQELAEILRTERPGIPVVFMSGYNEEAVVRDGVLADGTAFIEKPFSPAQLVDCVRTTLNLSGTRAPAEGGHES